MSVLKFIEAGVAAGWHYQPCGHHRAKRLTTRSLVRWYKSLGFVPRWPGEGETILVWRAE